MRRDWGVTVSQWTRESGWRGALLGAAIALAGCQKDAPITGRTFRASLQLQAVMANAGEQLDVAVGYARTALPDVSLARVQKPVTGPGRLDVPIELDLTTCLSDASRLGGSAAGCPVMASIVLRDAAGIALDSARIGPLEVREGATVSPAAPVVLQAAATLVIESGDQQVGWNGQMLHLPVVARLTDRSGGPIAARRVTVTPGPGGGTVNPASTLVTDVNGRVSIGYRLGPTSGTQGFGVSAPAGSATVTASVGLVAIEPRRERAGSGALFGCAILAGTTHCWGSNDGGALGNRAVAVPGDSTYPVAVAGVPPFVALSVNRANNIYVASACGLTATGAVYCWGVTPLGSLGPAPADVCQPFSNQVPCNREPRLLPGVPPFAVIDLGGGIGVGGSTIHPERLCGVATNGDAWCWGNNLEGAVGNGVAGTTQAPTVVTGGRKWIDISTGHSHSCGITALGEALCWGSNARGQLGTGDTVSTQVPRAVATSERFVAIDAGNLTTCALTVSQQLRCWGGVTAVSPAFFQSTDPRAPDGPVRAYVRLSVGATHGCAVTAAGAGYCFGVDGTGRFGAGFPSPGLTTTPVLVKSNVPLSDIGVGILGSCAVSVAGDGYCWGSGTRGMLANGSRTITAYVPSKVTFTPPIAGVARSVFQFGNFAPWSVRGAGCGSALGVQVVDANGYVVAGEVVSFRAITPGATVSTLTGTTNATGWVSVSCTVSNTVGPNVFVAKVASVPNDSVVFTTSGQVPGPPASVFCRFCLAGFSTTVGTTRVLAPTGPVVVVSDSLGLPVSGSQVSFSRVTNSGAAFTPSLPATLSTDAFGQVSLTSFTADTIARVDTVLAVVAGLSSPPQYVIFSGTPASPATLRFGAIPSGSVAGQVIVPAVTVTLRDRYGNLTTNASPTAVTLTLTGSGGGTLAGTTTVNAVNGIATFSGLAISAPGTYQLTATVTGLGTAITVPFAVQ